MDDRRLELRVALLALAAFASGVGLLWLLGSFSASGDAHLRIDFAHSGGVPVGAPVKVSGVVVGRVRALELQPERLDSAGRPLPVNFDITLDGAVLGKLHRDATVGVATQGPLGEPFIEIEPGRGLGPMLKSGDELRGQDPARIDQLIARMDSLVDAAASLLGSGELDGGATGFLVDAAHLTHDADSMLVSNRPALEATLQDVREAAKDLRAISEQSKELLASSKVRGMVDDAAAIASNLRENVPPTAADARHLMHSANNLGGVFEPQDGADLKAALARYEKASASLEDIATRADRIIQEVDQGKGSVGGLLKDDQVYKDLKDLVSDLKKHPWKVFWKN